MDLPDPAEEAKTNFSTANAITNLRDPATATLSFAGQQQTGIERAEALVNEYRKKLDSANWEEEVQVYLLDHPELLYPEMLKNYPKFKLGDKHVTDFVCQIQVLAGSEYVFVEIENPKKEIFVKRGISEQLLPRQKNN